MTTLPLFDSWLRSQNYAEQTITATVQRVRALGKLAAKDRPAVRLSPLWRPHLIRVLGGCAVGCPDLTPEVCAYAQAALDTLDAPKLRGLRGGRKPKTRKHEAKSVPDEEWGRLLEALSIRRTGESEGPCAVLYLEACTGLRVGDVLRIGRRAVVLGAREGVIRLAQKGGRTRVLYTTGAPDAWARLAAVCEAGRGENVAEAISGSSCVSSSCRAYWRCKSLLHAVGAELGLEGRMHTHRLRRTVGVQALRLTEDVAAVGELLGHTPGSRATFAYLDEARPERVAGLTAQIRERFGGSKP